MLLYGVFYVVIFYLMLTLTVGGKMFGQKRKQKREAKKSKFDEEKGDSSLKIQQTNENENKNNQPTDGKKLKLSVELDELEFVEEKSSVDENIMSSLSLGPSSLDTARNSGINNGSWFKKELNNCFDGNNHGRSSLPADSNSLIWPARFHVNGVTLRERNTTNYSTFVTKTSEKFGEFSDCEGDLAQAENYNSGKRTYLHPMKRRKKERTCCRNCDYVQRVLLVCSLTLNVILLWMWKNS